MRFKSHCILKNFKHNKLIQRKSSFATLIFYSFHRYAHFSYWNFLLFLHQQMIHFTPFLQNSIGWFFLYSIDELLFFMINSYYYLCSGCSQSFLWRYLHFTQEDHLLLPKFNLNLEINEEKIQKIGKKLKSTLVTMTWRKNFFDKVDKKRIFF